MFGAGVTSDRRVHRRGAFLAALAAGLVAGVLPGTVGTAAARPALAATAVGDRAVAAASRDLPGDLNGDTVPDIWTVDSSRALRTYVGHGDGRFDAPFYGGQTFGGASVTTSGDWGQDGHNDLVTLEPGLDGTMHLWDYPNDGSGVAVIDGIDAGKQELRVECPFVAPPTDDYPWGCGTADNHWYDADQVTGAGDLNGDGQPDLLVREGRYLWAYDGIRVTRQLDGGGGPTLVGDDWDGFTVIAVADLNADGLPDLLARSDANGDVYGVYGQAGANPTVVDPTSWGDPGAWVLLTHVDTAAFPVLGSSGDITGDAVPDLWGRGPDDSMTGWPGIRGSGGQWDVGAPFGIAGGGTA